MVLLLRLTEKSQSLMTTAVYGTSSVQKQEKNDGFLPTARHGKKDGGGGSREGGGNRNDALGPRVQELFEFSLYLMKWPGKTNFTSGGESLPKQCPGAKVARTI